jgi:hypothetical protein
LIPVYWIGIFVFAIYEAARIRGVWDRFSLIIIVLRIVAALAMIGLMGTNINPGGDGLRYRDAAEALAFQPTASLREIARLWGDYRYVPYIAISSFFEALGSTYFVGLFQTFVHLLGGFFLYGALLRCTPSKTLARVLFLAYALLPMLVYYSHVYLRDIYLSFATAWFIYGLTCERRSQVIVNVICSLSIVAAIRLQYLPIYALGVGVFLLMGGKSSKLLSTALVVLLAALFFDFAYYFSPDRFVPYLVASGAIDIDSSVSYDSINALDYFSVGAWLKTIVGIFGPYHMFYGPAYLLVEYRGDYVERLAEGTSAFFFATLVVATFIQLFVGRSWAGATSYRRMSARVRSSELQAGHSATPGATRRVVAVCMSMLIAMSIILTLVGYNRWRMPLIPIYFVLCAAFGTRTKDLKTAGACVLIAFAASLLIGSI